MRGNTLASLGVHNFTCYNIRNTNGTSIIVQDFEKFSGKSGQIISGLDSTASDLFLSVTWSSITNRHNNFGQFHVLF